MRADLIKAAAMAIVVAGSDNAEQVRRYSHAFDEAGTGADRNRVLPCPRCFLAGVFSGMRPLESRDQMFTLRCLVCVETLDYRATDR